MECGDYKFIKYFCDCIYDYVENGSCNYKCCWGFLVIICFDGYCGCDSWKGYKRIDW